MFKVMRKWLDETFAVEESIILLLIIVGSLLMLVSLGNVLAPVIASIILAFMMQGLIVQLVDRRVPSWAAITISFAVFVGSFFIALLVILPLAWNQMTALFSELPRMLSKWQQLMLVLPERYPTVFSEAQIEQWTILAQSELGQLGQVVVSFSISSIPNVVGLLIYIVLVPILVFFF